MTKRQATACRDLRDGSHPGMTGQHAGQLAKSSPIGSEAYRVSEYEVNPPDGRRGLP